MKMQYHNQNSMDRDEFSAWIHRFDEEISIEEIVDQFGIARKGFKILCPNPEHDDHNFGSCDIQRDRNRIKCWACEKSFRVTDVVQMLTGMNIRQVCDSLAQAYGLPTYQEAVSKSEATGRRREPMPLNYEQMKYLRLLSSGTGFMPTGYSDVNPGREVPHKDELYDNENWGYITGKTVSFSLANLWNENPEGFHYIVSNRVKERWVYFLSQYNAKVWLYPEYGMETKDALEHALDVIQPLAERYGIKGERKQTRRVELAI